MEPRDITNELLIGIRDEIRLTNSRLDWHERTLLRATEQLGRLTNEVTQVSARLDRQEARFEGITEILSRMDRRLEHVEGSIDRAFDVAANPASVEPQRRVGALEHKTE